MKIINAKGKVCPQPLIMTKKALLEIEDSETLQILVDNDSAKFNVSRYLSDHKMEVQVKESHGVYEILVVKKGGSFEQSIPEEYCEVPGSNKGDYMVCVKKDKFGEGDAELGQLLMTGFFNTLPHVNHLPKSIVFVNSGISLVLHESSVLEPIQKLEAMGVKILICGTCLEYYKKMDKLEVGQVSNMLDILEQITAAGKVIYP